MAAMFIMEGAHSWPRILLHIESINENISQGHDDYIVFLFVCVRGCVRLCMTVIYLAL